MFRTAFVAAVCVVSLIAAAAPSLAQPAASPSPSSLEASKDGGGEKDKPSWWDVEGRVKKAISEWFADLVRAALEPVFKLLGRTVFSTPHLEDQSRIKELWRFSLGIADASLMLFVLVGAGIITVSSDIGAQVSAKEAIPRFFLAAGAANASLLLLEQMISLSNALSRGILESIQYDQIGHAMADRLFNGAFTNIFLALLVLVVIVLGVLVAITYVMRIAVMVVLTAAAPMLLITHALPHSENWARIWWRGNLALLAAPVVQSFLIVTAFEVFLSGDGMLGWGQGGLIDILVIGCILYMLFKVPIWALDTALHGSGSKVSRKIKGYITTAGKLVASA